MRKNTNKKQILIVEGESDRSCMEKLCEHIQLSPTVVLPVTPRDLEDDIRNGKQGVYQTLDDRLPDLRDASVELERIALIVDADQTGSNNGGYQGTFQQVESRLLSYGYKFSAEKSEASGGLIFDHLDEGIYPIGVWIMPDNLSDGVLEHWLSSCIADSEKTMITHAQLAVANVPIRKFADLRSIKAEVATWLAWQKQPSIGLYAAFDDEGTLLNDQAHLYTQMVSWLRYVFSDS